MNNTLISGRIAPRLKGGSPLESSEQAALVRRLRVARLVFFAVPNGGSRRAGEGARLKSQGVAAGVPDLIILTPPPGRSHGTALELKRGELGIGSLSISQGDWLRSFVELGWCGIVGYGCEDAVLKLRSIGYTIP